MQMSYIEISLTAGENNFICSEILFLKGNIITEREENKKSKVYIRLKLKNLIQVQ